MKDQEIYLEKKDSLKVLSEQLQMYGLEHNTEEEKFAEFASFLEHLLHNDPNKLIAILYRIDVSEKKLKQTLAENKQRIPEGQIIANLLIERQREKIKFRKKYAQENKI